MSLSQCIKQDEENNGNGQQEEEFDLQEAAECGRLDVDEEAAQYYTYQNGGQNYNQYNNQNQQNVEFVGPTCSSNGKSINLVAVFMDKTCSYSAPDGVYEKFHYGKKLPYSSSSIVEHDCYYKFIEECQEECYSLCIGWFICCHHCCICRRGLQLEQESEETSGRSYAI